MIIKHYNSRTAQTENNSELELVKIELELKNTKAIAQVKSASIALNTALFVNNIHQVRLKPLWKTLPGKLIQSFSIFRFSGPKSGKLIQLGYCLGWVFQRSVLCLELDFGWVFQKSLYDLPWKWPIRVKWVSELLNREHHFDCWSLVGSWSHERLFWNLLSYQIFSRQVRSSAKDRWHVKITNVRFLGLKWRWSWSLLFFKLDLDFYNFHQKIRNKKLQFLVSLL